MKLGPPHATRWRGACASALVGLCLAACAQPAPAPGPTSTHRPWKLLVYHAPRPGVLSLCRDLHQWPNFDQFSKPEAGAPGKARWIEESVTVTWHGGHFGRKTEAAAVAPALLDTCFTLFVEDKPVLSGGVVHSMSARLMDMPTLVIERRPAGAPLALTLLPHFPADLREPVPAWDALLRGLDTGE